MQNSNSKQIIGSNIFSVLGVPDDRADEYIRDIHNLQSSSENSDIDNKGLHVILGLPRSGKSLIASNFPYLNSDSSKVRLLEMDEPGSELFFNSNAEFVQELMDFLSSSQTCFVIDSFRLMISQLTGNLGEGGISTFYKRIVTDLNNIALSLNKRIVVVFTGGFKFLEALRASVTTLTVCHNNRYVHQTRNSTVVSGSSFKVILPAEYAKLGVSLAYIDDYVGKTLNSEVLFNRVAASFPWAVDYLNSGLPQEGFEYYERSLLSRARIHEGGEVMLDTVGKKGHSLQFHNDSTGAPDDVVIGNNIDNFFVGED